MSQKVLNYNFNILLSGVFIKSLGSGIYSIAAMMLVLHMSGDPFYSGVAFFVVTLPACFSFLIAPFANYVSYKKALISCELLKAILLLIVPILYFFGMLHVFILIMTMFCVSMLSNFTYPIETTLVPIFVGKKNVVKANSYLNMLRESLDIIFLAVAGIMIAAIGSITALLITAGCHLIIACLYLFFRLESSKRDQSFGIKRIIKKYTIDLREGLAYIRYSILPHIIAGAVFINFFTGSMFASIPSFSLMKGESEAYYGYYMVAMTLGLFIGSFITPRMKHLSYSLLTIGASFLSGTFWIGSAYLSTRYSLIFYCIGFIGVGVINILIFSIIQQQVEEKMIGRVITILVSLSAIGQPIGSLFGGTISSVFSPIYPVIMAGFSMVVFSIYFFLHPLLRSLQSVDQLNLLKKPSS